MFYTIIIKKEIWYYLWLVESTGGNLLMVGKNHPDSHKKANNGKGEKLYRTIAEAQSILATLPKKERNKMMIFKVLAEESDIYQDANELFLLAETCVITTIEPHDWENDNDILRFV